MSETIVVVGAGGFGREALEVIEAINTAAPRPVWDVLGVVDDHPADIQVERLNDRGIRLLGGLEVLREQDPGCWYVIGIGAPAIRRRIARCIDSLGLRAATLVHPSAVVGTKTDLAPGTIVCGGAQLSTNLRLGSHTHVNPGVIIGHDSVLEDFVSINPGTVVSGEVHVGSETLIGAGATVLQGLSLGSGVTVGASACVTRNVPSDVLVVGVPAKRVGNGNAPILGETTISG